MKRFSRLVVIRISYVHGSISTTLFGGQRLCPLEAQW
jgi:hypothetical protein